jgi:hypothetical protein
MKDPFVDEVRKFRMEHTRRCKTDLRLICEDLRKFESSLGRRVVMIEPRRLGQARKSRR